MDLLSSYRSNQKRTMLRVLPSSLLINILSLSIPLVVLQIYDRILPNQSYGTAVLLLSGASIAILIDAFLRFVRSWILAAASINTETKMYSYILHQLTELPAKQLLSLKPGHLQEGLKGISSIKEFYSGGLLSGLIDVPFVLIFLSLVAYVGGELVLIPIIVWIIAAVFVCLFSNKSYQHAKTAAGSEISRMNFLVIVFTMLEGVKKQAAESRTFQYFKELNQSRWLSVAESERNTAIAQECIQIAALGTSVVMVIIGSLSVLSGELTTGGLAACSILSGRAVAPMSALVGLRLKYSSFQVANNSVKDLFKNISSKETVTSEKLPAFESLTAKNYHIERFGFCHQLSLSVNKGDIVTFYGGDTDLCSQLMSNLSGLEAKTEGELLWNNQVSTSDYYDYRNQTAFVTSRPILISGSLLDNLTGFNVNQVKEVLPLIKALGLDNVISELPNGLETKVGFQLGEQLSQGGVKLVSLVCQLAKPVPLLFLDKPEIALDIESVTRLAKVLSILSSNGKTIILNTDHPLLVELSKTQAELIPLQGEG
ncbi:ABC transporter transmembrane domain-containing protein [Aliivibrio sp. 1S128]|uniref:ABC transporter transmembrane domain-containing protein n=4 Tax=Aliivibrio TaxID=511678 RepID=UPI00080DE372|nr:ABC transporter transmembrane domain-containing protein [Aliivibrio sp. 1S128]OCH15288.1 ABC transporter permease [Aliivibrio sp. 1S128]